VARSLVVVRTRSSHLLDCYSALELLCTRCRRRMPRAWPRGSHARTTIFSLLIIIIRLSLPVSPMCVVDGDVDSCVTRELKDIIIVGLLTVQKTLFVSSRKASSSLRSPRTSPCRRHRRLCT